MNVGHTRGSIILAALALFVILPGCPPVTLKTLELHPIAMVSPFQFKWFEGVWCAFAGPDPNGQQPPWSAGPGEIMSGFDDFYDPGSGLFPCIQKTDFHYNGGVKFDLSQFDQIASAELQFDAIQSIRRRGGEVTGQNPPVSNATTLGMGTADWSDLNLPFDNEVTLPTEGPFRVGVSSQVNAWTTKTHGNFGFVIAGPRLTFPSGSDLPSDNDADITWYGSFKLVVVYNSALNPRAPQ